MMFVLRSSRDDDVDAQDVLDALADETCQVILSELDEPKTAQELVEACDVSESTLYRKLERLKDASLLRSGLEIRADGHHTLRYEIDFDEVAISVDDERTLGLEISQSSPSPEDSPRKPWLGENARLRGSLSQSSD